MNYSDFSRLQFSGKAQNRQQDTHSTDLLDRSLPRVDKGAAGPEVGRSVHEGERPLAAPARPGGAPAHRPGVVGHEPRREGVAARGAPHLALGALCRLAKERDTTSELKRTTKVNSPGFCFCSREGMGSFQPTNQPTNQSTHEGIKLVHGIAKKLDESASTQRVFPRSSRPLPDVYFDIQFTYTPCAL